MQTKENRGKFVPDIGKLKAGDVATFDIIYRQFAPKLYSFSLKLLKNKMEAEGIVQETFLKIWSRRAKLRSDTSFESYLFTIAYNACIDSMRKEISKRKHNELDVLGTVVNDYQSTPETELEMKQLQERVTMYIDLLPPRQKQIFKLHREENLSYSQIAEQLGLSPNTVENHMVRAIKNLRDKFSNEISMIFLLFGLVV